MGFYVLIMGIVLRLPMEKIRLVRGDIPIYILGLVITMLTHCFF